MHSLNVARMICNSSDDSYGQHNGGRDFCQRRFLGKAIRGPRSRTLPFQGKHGCFQVDFQFNQQPKQMVVFFCSSGVPPFASWRLTGARFFFQSLASGSVSVPLTPIIAQVSMSALRLPCASKSGVLSNRCIELQAVFLNRTSGLLCPFML